MPYWNQINFDGREKVVKYIFFLISYIRFSQALSGEVYRTFARGVLYLLTSPTKTR